MKRLLFLYIIIGNVLQAQFLWGPVIGNTSYHSTTIKVGVKNINNVRLNLFSDQNYNNLLSSYTSTPVIGWDTIATFNLTSLTPGTNYYFQIVQNTDTLYGSFKTFSNTGIFRVAFGSCLWKDSIFNTIKDYNPDLTIIIGDWGYYDNEPDSLTDTLFISDDSLLLRQAWRKRYSMPILKNFMANHSIAYIWDDHDFTSVDASRDCILFYDTTGGNVNIHKIFYNSNTKQNALSAYNFFFPHYNLVDSVMIAQKVDFPYGSLYLLDMRSQRNSHLDAFQKIGNIWQFNPSPYHTILGNLQKNWLFNDLRNNNLTWKVLFSSVIFNRKLRNIINTLLLLQYINPLVGGVAVGMGDSWFGYPYEQDSFLNFLQLNNINNVIIGTGDIHSSAIDDGTNAGIPEIVAANIGQDNSKLFYILDSLTNGNASQYWNKGGQGIGNNNYNLAFGLITFYKNDSCKLQIVDIYKNVIAEHTIYNLTTNVNYSENKIKVYFNPLENKIEVILPSGEYLKNVQLYDYLGRLIKHSETEINADGVCKGYYIVKITTSKNIYYRRIYVK